MKSNLRIDRRTTWPVTSIGDWSIDLVTTLRIDLCNVAVLSRYNGNKAYFTALDLSARDRVGNSVGPVIFVVREKTAFETLRYLNKQRNIF